MELEEFIKKTLVGIAVGIRGANKEIGRSGDTFKIEPVSWYEKRTDGCIEFDIAVAVSDEDKKGGGAGLKVLSIGIDGKREHSISNQVTSRIKFRVAPSYQIF
ncbi:MAG: hypothetical protein HY481_02515 [Candidatus Vogelbacteria bacterium]|nr:hypothetical protein [Candidatus Vogelbacteria bacterium]